MYNWLSWLFSRNKYNIVNQLYSNKNLKQIKKGYSFISFLCVYLILNSEYLNMFMSLTA